MRAGRGDKDDDGGEGQGANDGAARHKYVIFLFSLSPFMFSLFFFFLYMGLGNGGRDSGFGNTVRGFDGDDGFDQAGFYLADGVLVGFGIERRVILLGTMPAELVGFMAIKDLGVGFFLFFWMLGNWFG